MHSPHTHAIRSIPRREALQPRTFETKRQRAGDRIPRSATASSSRRKTARFSHLGAPERLGQHCCGVGPKCPLRCSARAFCPCSPTPARFRSCPFRLGRLFDRPPSAAAAHRLMATPRRRHTRRCNAVHNDVRNLFAIIRSPGAFQLLCVRLTAFTPRNGPFKPATTSRQLRIRCSIRERTLKRFPASRPRLRPISNRGRASCGLRLSTTPQACNTGTQVQPATCQRTASHDRPRPQRKPASLTMVHF